MNNPYVGFINAQQAQDLALKHDTLFPQVVADYIIKEKAQELSLLNLQIQRDANLGLYSTKYWIKYNATYNELISKGYVIHGGVIRENVPDTDKSSWGTISDQCTISWNDDSSL